MLRKESGRHKRFVSRPSQNKPVQGTFERNIPCSGRPRRALGGGLGTAAFGTAREAAAPILTVGVLAQKIAYPFPPPFEQDMKRENNLEESRRVP